MLVYPKNKHRTDSQSIFFIGSAKEYCRINGEDIKLFTNGSFSVIEKLKLGDNEFEVDIDGAAEIVHIEGIKAKVPHPVAYGKHYKAFPPEQKSKSNILRSILVSDNQIRIPLNVAPMYNLEKHGSYKLVMDLGGIDSDLDWIHYDCANSNIIIGEVLDSKFPIIFKKPIDSYEEQWDGDALILDFKYKESNFKVCLDPGHGGTEDGSISPQGFHEKDLNLKLAKKVFDELQKLNIDTVMTRTDDSTVELKDRVNLAKEENCQLLLSIHHNALPDGRDPCLERGISSHYYHEQSKAFANFLLDNLVGFTELPCHGLYRQNLHVLRESPDYVAVLVEMGFLIHPEESEVLLGEEYQDLSAKIIAKSVYNFFLKDLS